MVVNSFGGLFWAYLHRQFTRYKCRVPTEKQLDRIRERQMPRYLWCLAKRGERVVYDMAVGCTTDVTLHSFINYHQGAGCINVLRN